MAMYYEKGLKAFLKVGQKTKNIYVTKHTQLKWGGGGVMFLTVRHCWKSKLRILSASSTMRPAITALVVAMAGMMFPAMARGGKNTTTTPPNSQTQIMVSCIM